MDDVICQQRRQRDDPARRHTEQHRRHFAVAVAAMHCCPDDDPKRSKPEHRRRHRIGLYQQIGRQPETHDREHGAPEQQVPRPPRRISAGRRLAQQVGQHADRDENA